MAVTSSPLPSSVGCFPGPTVLLTISAIRVQSSEALGHQRGVQWFVRRDIARSSHASSWVEKRPVSVVLTFEPADLLVSWSVVVETVCTYFLCLKLHATDCP